MWQEIPAPSNTYTVSEINQMLNHPIYCSGKRRAKLQRAVEAAAASMTTFKTAHHTFHTNQVDRAMNRVWIVYHGMLPVAKLYVQVLTLPTKYQKYDGGSWEYDLEKVSGLPGAMLSRRFIFCMHCVRLCIDRRSSCATRLSTKE